MKRTTKKRMSKAPSYKQQMLNKALNAARSARGAKKKTAAKKKR